MDLFANFLNSGLTHDERPPEELRRVRYANLGAMALAGGSLPYVPYYIWLGSPLTATVLCLAILTCVFVVVDLRKRRQPEQAGAMATGAAYVTIFAANVEAGGLFAVASPWWLVVPVFGTLIGGVRVGVWWCVAVMVAICGLALAFTHGALPPMHGPEDYFVQAFSSVVGSVLVNLVLCAGFVQQSALAHARTQQSLDRLREEVVSRTRAEAEARAASDARTRFVAMMSHEIRTPLHGVHGMTQLLRETDLAPDQQRMVSVALSATRALQAVLDDVLDFSKLDADHLELEAIDVPVRCLVEDTVELFASMGREKGLVVRCEIADDVPCRVIGDPTRLRQVLANLLSNALKFTDEGQIGIRMSREGEALRFEVYDTGLGIEPTALATLFEPFTQAETSITRRFGGTGLGLSICRALVRLMGGDIEVRSQPGQGSTFTFVVALPESTAPVAQEETSLEALRKLRVLVADDNPVNQMVVRTLLSRDGHESVVVDDGDEAVEAARRSRFDLILLDLQMARMGGLEAARQIRAMSASRERTPIVALTANAGEETRTICFEAGMDEVLFKPFVLEEFRQVVARFSAERALPALV